MKCAAHETLRDASVPPCHCTISLQFRLSLEVGSPDAKNLRDSVYKEVIIVDEEGREVPLGTPGEILVRGGFMRGYWRMSKETAETTRGGWLHTSDIGLMDELDNVYWLARKTEVIHAQKGPIYPRVIEEALFAHKSVRHASVVGKGEIGNQTPVGFVTLFAQEIVSDEKLLSHCKSVLGESYWPSRIVIKREFPMTPTGKIDKKQLKE